VKSPLAREAPDRIAKLYKIEDRIHGLPPEEWLDQRKTYAAPMLNAMRMDDHEALADRSKV
jgi:hypothetical protein